jgi:uncharacterized membrane protein YhiD involved in acid resistance
VLASIGLAIGAGYFTLAGAATLVTVGTLFGLDKVERRLPEGVVSREYTLEGAPDLSLIEMAEDCVRRLRARIYGLRVEKSEAALTLHFVVRCSPRMHRKLAESLLRLERVKVLKQR